MLNAGLNRTVAVIDGDIATCKGLTRIGKEADFSVTPFPDCKSLAKWLDEQVRTAVPAYKALCLVVDVRSLIADADWCADENIQNLPKICVGTPAAMSALGGQMNAFQGEYCRKPFTLNTIQAQIETAFDRYADRLSAVTEGRNLIALFGKLTAREMEVAGLVGSGRANLEIAALMGITLKTVKAHRAKVMEKTGSNTIADFVRKYERYLHAVRGRNNASGIGEVEK